MRYVAADSANRPPKVKTGFSASKRLRSYFIYDRPTFAVNSRDKIACSSRTRRYDRTRVAELSWNRSLATARGSDLNKCTHPPVLSQRIYLSLFDKNKRSRMPRSCWTRLYSVGVRKLRSTANEFAVVSTMSRLCLKVFLFLSAKARISYCKQNTYFNY